MQHVSFLQDRPGSARTQPVDEGEPGLAAVDFTCSPIRWEKATSAITIFRTGRARAARRLG
jgi:hypothetical protein